MKSNFKSGEKVKVIKPGKFIDLEGEVISNDEEKIINPLLIDLSPYGRWSFNYTEVISLSQAKKAAEKMVWETEPVKVKIPKGIKESKESKPKTKNTKKQNGRNQEKTV